MSDNSYGYFVDPWNKQMIPQGEPVVFAAWARDGTRDMYLIYPVVYIDPDGNELTIPAGFKTNGLSTPRFFWRLVPPFEPLSREASVVHDWLCHEYGLDGWDKSADVFYWCMLANGFGKKRAFVRWVSVRYFGKWFVALSKWLKGRIR